jgi:hypothetical protein
MQNLLNFSGIVRLLQYRDGRLFRDIQVKNKIVWGGKTDLLNQFFKSTALWSGFHVGLIKNDWDQFTENTPSIVTLASKQFTTYDEATRPTLTFEVADSGTDANYIFIQNSSSNYATFTVSTGVTNQLLDGIFIASTNVKADTPARIWCSAAFGNDDYNPAPVTVNAADILRVQYTVRIPKAGS